LGNADIEGKMQWQQQQQNKQNKSVNDFCAIWILLCAESQNSADIIHTAGEA